MKAIQIETFGNPVEVVKAVDLPDVGAPATGEVVIALEASPINQYEATYVAASGNTDAEGGRAQSDPSSGAVRPSPNAFRKMSAPLTGITLGAP
jgi:hypothetical protein